MKIFMTGGTGFIGSRLVKRISDRGDEIVCLTRDISKVSIPVHDKVNFIEGDIAQPKTYESFLPGVDYIYHLSAFARHLSFKRLEAYRVNYLGTKKIFELAELYNIPVLYLSSAVIFHPMRESIPNERSQFPKKFVNYYSYSKYLGYLEAQNFIKKGVKIISVLPTSVYGIGSPLFSEFLYFILTKKIFFKNLLNRKLSMVYVDDVIKAIIKAEERSNFGESYLLAAKTITIKELLKRVEDFFNIHIKIYNIPKFFIKFSLNIYDLFFAAVGKNSYPNREIFNFLDGNFVASAEKAKLELNWMPRDFEVTFKEMLDWYNKLYYRNNK